MKRLAANKIDAALRLFKTICRYFDMKKINDRWIGQDTKLKIFHCIIQTILKRLAANKIAAAVRLFKIICS